MPVGVVTAVADPRHEASVAAAVASAPGLVVVRRCVEVADVLAVAVSGGAGLAVVSADFAGLDREVVARLGVLGVDLVGLVGSPEDEARLDRLGVRTSVRADAAPADLVAGITAALVSTPAQPPAPAPADPSADRPTADAPTGGILAVWGPTGGPGRTTVAAGIAAELAAAGREVVLVDADPYGGTLAISFGVAAHDGLAAACAAAADRVLAPADVAAHAVTLAPRLRLVAGVPDPGRWVQLRPTALAAVLAAARNVADHVVVDVGFCLEDDPDAAYDVTAPRRNAATVTALAAADTVLAVGTADPVGLVRLATGLGELARLRTPARPLCLVNRLRPGLAPGDPAVQVEQALARHAGVRPWAALPDDPDALDRAARAGRALADVAPRAPVRRALADVAARIAGAGPRRRRLAALGRR